MRAVYSLRVVSDTSSPSKTFSSAYGSTTLGSFIFILDMDNPYTSLLKGRSDGGVPMTFFIVALGAHHDNSFAVLRQTYQLLYGFVPAHVYASTTEVLTTIEVLDISLC